MPRNRLQAGSYHGHFRGSLIWATGPELLTKRADLSPLRGVPRKLRLEFPDACYHVINRGNYRRNLFEPKGAAESFEKGLGRNDAVGSSEPRAKSKTER